MNQIKKREAQTQGEQGRAAQKREPCGATVEAHQAPPRPGPTTASGQAAGGATADGSQTSERTPRPSARASDAHDPEPDPEKHADGDADGTSAPAPGAGGGQDRPGADSQSPDGPAAATWPTTAMERRARAARWGTPEAVNAEAWTTVADGTARRAAVSMPGAQPVTTRASGASWRNARRTARAHPGAGWREPETPTTVADARRWETVETDTAATVRRGHTPPKGEPHPAGMTAAFRPTGGERQGRAEPRAPACREHGEHGAEAFCRSGPCGSRRAAHLSAARWTGPGFDLRPGTRVGARRAGDGAQRPQIGGWRACASSRVAGGLGWERSRARRRGASDRGGRSLGPW